MSGESAGLTQELVNEGGLAVVDVGDDGDIANGAGHDGLGRGKTGNFSMGINLP